MNLENISHISIIVYKHKEINYENKIRTLIENL